VLPILRSAALRYREQITFERIFQRFESYTMIPTDVFVSNLRLAARVLDVKGCIVECGVWRGGMSAGLATLFGPNRKYCLFDSFEGLPPAREIDGSAAMVWQQRVGAPEYFDNCSAPIEYAQDAMSKASAVRVEIVRGWFANTVRKCLLGEPIALLRLDADWYESTIVCLDAFFDQVAPGGMIIIDDYYTWDGCSRAVHDFLSRHSAVERIQCFEGVCYLGKI